MKKYFALFVVTLLTVTATAEARVSGLMNGGENLFSTSLQYQVTSGGFERINVNDQDDTDVDQRLRLIRLDFTPLERIQLYGTVGNGETTFGDTETENGTVVGGGAQLLVSKTDDLRLELTGSYLQHESVDLDGTGGELEVKDDWQGGIQLSRDVRPSHRMSDALDYDAFLSILYSDRTVDVTGPGTTREFEMTDGGGLSATAGVNLHYAEGINLEFEGEFGAMTSASGRLIFSF